MAIKLTRVVSREAVAQMCMDYGFYTKGDEESYLNLLNNLCSSGGSVRRLVSDSDIEEIARDIVSHSDCKVFGKYFKDTSYMICVRNVAELVADRCGNVAVMC